MTKKILIAMRDFGRPMAVATLLFVLLVGALVSGILEAYKPGMGVTFTAGIAGWFNAIPGEYYTLTGALALGYTASRGAEKIVQQMQDNAPPKDEDFDKLTE